MASQDEVIRYVYEVSGSKDLQDAARTLLSTGEATEETEAAIRSLADEFGALSKAASSAAGLRKTVEEFRTLGGAVLDLQKRIEASRTKVADLGRALSENEAPTKAQTRAFESARNELAKLEKAQDRQRAKLREMKGELQAAGLSTRNLVAAERDLATRVAQTETAMAGVVANARGMAQSRRDAAAAERVLLDALRATAAQEQRAKQVTEQLERARAILAQRSREGVASERAYANTLGTSAAKIAALGAAALGINSAVGLARRGLTDLLETAGRFQQLDVQLGSVFEEQAAEAEAAIREFATETPYQLQQVSDAFVKLKAFGLDPLDGTFEAIADQAAKLGGTQESLTGITLALGQAWAKQKLQGEEILQLVERGVPVWDLLQRATGKNVQELQKLSAAGKLGRAEIKLLIEEIGRSADGAAAKLADTLPGRINQLRSQWADFLNLIANSGVLDYLQEQLGEVSDEIKRMSETGELQEWARDVSDAIVGTAKAIQGTLGFLVEHRKAILALAAAYASLKVATGIGAFVAMLGKMTPGLVAATTAMRGASLGAGALTTQLGLLAAAGGFTASQLLQLAPAFEELAQAQDELRAAQQATLDQTEEFARTGHTLREEYAQFANVAIASAEELGAKTADSLDDYVASLRGAIEYTRGLGKEAIAAGDDVARLGAQQHIVELRDAIEAARAKMAELRAASVAALSDIGEAGIEAAQAYDDMIAKGETAREAVSKLFNDIHLTDASGLADVADILHTVGTRGTEAGQAIRDELRAQILKLSDEDFAKFRNAAVPALADAKVGAQELAGAIEGINLARLGVDIEQIRTGFSGVGRAAIDAFNAAVDEVDNLGLTAEQRAAAIAQAFDEAFGRAKTLADIEGIKQALMDAFAAGDIGAQAFSQRMDEVQAKIDGLGQRNTAAGKQTAKSFDGATESIKKTAAATDEAAAATEAAAAATEEAGEAAQQSTRSYNALAAVQAQWAAQFAQVSQEAADRFNKLVLQIYRGADAFSFFAAADTTGLRRWAESIEKAANRIQEQIENQRLGVAQLSDDYTHMGEEAAEALARQSGGFEEAAQRLDAMAKAATSGALGFDLLGKSDLSPLQSALASAAARVRQLGQEALEARAQIEQIGASIQDQIDQIRGNDAAIEERRYTDQLERLRELAEESGSLNSAEYNEAVRDAKRLHDLKMRQIKEEAAARKKADADRARDEESAASSPPPAKPPRDGGSGGSSAPAGPVSNVTINLDGTPFRVRTDEAGAATIRKLFDLLRQGRGTSGGFPFG